jgi:hypothetical protein
LATPTYTPLANITLGSSAASVTFSSISQAYRDLILVATMPRTDVTDTNSYVRLNSDTGSNYSYVQMFGNGSAGYSNSASSQTTARAFTYQNTTSRQYNGILQLMDYSATDKHKTFLTRYNGDDSGVGAFALRWASTSAVTTLLVYPGSGSYAAGSTFALYGVAA